VALLAQIAERHGVQVYIEPGEAIALDAGILVGEILDTFDNAMPVAITDISATCHMPDVIEAPYRPAMLDERPKDEGDEGVTVRIGGPSCLAGDIIGDYVFTSPFRRRGRASPSSTRPTIRWSRPTPSTACPCRRSRCGTARPTPVAGPAVRLHGLPRPAVLNP
jgi:hypothetical protein